MIFNSFIFCVFFLIVFSLHRVAAKSWRSQKLILLVASYLFYAAWNPPFVALLAISTIVDWQAAKWMQSATTQSAKKRALLLSLCSNLGMLAFFKYGGFLMENFEGLMSLAGVAYKAPEWSIILPVGISFYTFQTLSFSIDVYRGNLDPKDSSFLDFALFVSFFPQLVAGPIVRAVDFLPQLVAQRKTSVSQTAWGIVLLSVGVFEKSVLSDATVAPISDVAFGLSSLSVSDAWAGAFAFSCQIFFDFAGYSTCAIGTAMCFGFGLPANFHYPYGASSFSDFWRRWHISLSSWLRDYLYISLGGNRGGKNKTLRNLALTMLLGGLWHGASWNFVLWGALHGIYLIIERVTRKDYKRFDFAWWVFVQLCVLIAWVPFRSPSIGTTLNFLGAMVGIGTAESAALTPLNYLLVTAFTLAIYVGHRALRKTNLEQILSKTSGPILGLIIGSLWVAIWFAQPPSRAFIYFQF